MEEDLLKKVELLFINISQNENEIQYKKQNNIDFSSETDKKKHLNDTVNELLETISKLDSEMKNNIEELNQKLKNKDITFKDTKKLLQLKQDAEKKINQFSLLTEKLKRRTSFGEAVEEKYQLTYEDKKDMIMMKKAEKGERIYNGFRAIGIILIIIIIGTCALVSFMKCTPVDDE